MSDPKQAGPEETGAWHRHFAVSAFNRSWDLLDATDRDEAADDEMLAVAFASRWHWGAVGTVENQALGDHQIAKVASALGLADLALRFAGRALAAARAENWDGWRRASVYEGMARACHAAGDVEGRDGWLNRAREALDAIGDPEERAVIEEQLAQIPGWAG
jgi:hypothetical protein